MKPNLKAALTCLACLLMPLAGRAASVAVQAGDIFIVNHGDNSVYRINPTSGDQRKLGTFQTPTDLAVSPDGYLYISEYGGTIQRLNLTNGTLSVVNPLTTLWNVNGLALGPTGDLYVTCASSNSVVRINAATGAETEITRGDLLSVPIGIDFVDADHVVIASFLGNRVVKVALAGGAQSTVAQGANGIDRPWGIAVDGTNIYVAAKDSKLLQRILGTTVTTVRAMTSPMFGIGIEINGDIVVGEVLEVARVSPAGVVLRTFSGAYNEITAVEVSRITVEAVGVTNTPPVLGVITNRTVDENTLVSFAATATDTNWPPQVWTFSLGVGAPAGAAITTNGVFTWTPSEAQGPGTYPITVVVTDDGDPVQSASNTFTVTVTEVNTAPSMALITNRTVIVGEPITFTVTGSDADLPAQTLTFTLLPGAPEGATITANGFFSWTPTGSQAPSTNVIRVKLTDDGTPPMSKTNTFTVVVNQVNGPPTIDPITNPVVNEGSLLRFNITASDTNRPPQQLIFSLGAGAPVGASLTTNGVFSWTPTEAQGPGAYAIGVQVTDNGAPPLSGVAGFTVTVNEVNTAPVLDPMGDTTALLGTPVIRAFAATDADLPSQSLTFSLEPGAPAGATISPAGLFTWTPTGSQAVGTNVMGVIVTDSGVPSLTATQSFTVVVRATLSVEVGDIFVADYGGNEVLKINPQSGAIQSVGAFDAPTDVALASDGNLYIAEVFGTVRRLNLTNQTVSLVNTNTTLYDLWGIALAPSGDLLALNSADDSIVRIDPLTGSETLLSQTNLLSLPYGLDLLDDTHLVVSSFNNDRLVSVALAGGAQTLLVEANGITFPWGVAASPAGIYVASWDQWLIQRVSGGVVTDLLPTHGAPQGLAVETNGAVLAGVNGATSTLVRLNPDGSSSNLVAAGFIGPIAGIEVSKYRFGAVSGPNTAPIMAVIPNATLNEGELLSFTASAADADVPAQTLAFSLGTGAPEGAGITAGGVFNWTPTAAQGPATYLIQVIVTDGGTPSLSATNSFTVVVTEVIAAPVIVAHPQSQMVNLGAGATFSVTAAGSPPPAYQWRFNGTHLLAGQTNSTLLLTNVQDSDAGNYSVVVDNGLAVASSNALLTVNHLPVPASPALERYPTGGVKVRETLLLGTDPDGDPLFLSAVNASSAQGATVRASEGWVLYLPPPGLTNQDAFGYTVGDGRGGFSPGTATILIASNLGPSLNLTWDQPTNGVVRVSGSGIPQRSYLIEFTENLSPMPTWHYLGTVETDALGLFAYQDQPPAGSPSRCYRAICP